MAPAKKKKAPAKKAAPAKKSAKKPAPVKKAAPKSAPVMKNHSSRFAPLDDRIVISPEKMSEVTAGGIIIPGSRDERPNRGTVLAKGPGRRSKKGVIRPLDVNVGDRVLFPEFAGTKIQIDGDEFLILREEDLLGIVTL